MNSEFFQRHRAGLFLVVVVIFSLVCLTNRVDPTVHGIKSTIWFLVSPNVVYTGKFFNKLDSIRGRLFELARAGGENFILRKQNARMAQRQLQQKALASENNRLRRLLGLREKRFPTSIAAEIVGRDVRDWFHSVIINKGSDHDVQLSAAVMGGAADSQMLIGRVVEVNPTTSKVLLITDPVSAVSVSIEHKGDLGLLEGLNQPLVGVKYLSNRSKAVIGDRVMTMGLGGVFPPGVPIGSVIQVGTTRDGFFKEALVEPGLDFGSLREVLVLRREIVPALEEAP